MQVATIADIGCPQLPAAIEFGVDAHGFDPCGPMLVSKKTRSSNERRIEALRRAMTEADLAPEISEAAARPGLQA